MSMRRQTTQSEDGPENRGVVCTMTVKFYTVSEWANIETALAKLDENLEKEIGNGRLISMTSSAVRVPDPEPEDPESSEVPYYVVTIAYQEG
jgi:hypothetical protein